MLTAREAKYFYLDPYKRVVFYPHGLFTEGIIANTEDIQQILAKDYKLAEQKAWAFFALFIFILLKQVFSVLFLLVLISFFVIYEGQKNRTLRIKHKNLPRRKRIISKPAFISFITLIIFVIAATLITLQKLIHMNVGSRATLSEFLIWLFITVGAVLCSIWFRRHTEEKVGIRYDKILYGKSGAPSTKSAGKR